MISQLRTFPNQLTLLRLIFIPFIVIAILDDEWKWALGLFVLAGLTDNLDGLLARLLKQKTVLGQYLDPIADKLLLSTLFLVLSLVQKIPWKFTVLVFSRDVGIVVTSAILYATTSLREFPPSFLGKANTGAQIVTLFFVLLREVRPENWVASAAVVGLWATLAFTVLSGLHYIVIVNRRLRAAGSEAGATSGQTPAGS
ncbi:MAG TPA: CDP-alcohol phosphatidyltransferase family protein [Terriglobales bacterium]|nr:CDP-alcohol phosphatidyltransferase family protein [Terriglobales bacterium]